MDTGLVGHYDRQALGGLTVLCMTHWIQNLLHDVEDADAVRVGAGAGAGEAAAPAAAGIDAAVAALQLLLLASLLTATFASRTWRKYRSWAVAALRLAACFPVLQAAAGQHELAHEPGGLLAEILPLLLGPCAVRVCFLSIALPLDLLPHLLVQTACLAATVNPIVTQQACSLPLLGNALMEQCFATFHSLMSVGALGLLPPDHPAGDRVLKCAAALDFLTLWLGWLLPTYLAARGQHRWAVMLASGQRPTTSSAQDSMDSMAGTKGGKQAPEGSRHAPTGRVAAPAGRAGLWLQELQGCWSQLSNSLPGWMLENMFLQDGLPGQEWLAWFVWTALCWMGGTVMSTALATA